MPTHLTATSLVFFVGEGRGVVACPTVGLELQVPPSTATPHVALYFNYMPTHPDSNCMRTHSLPRPSRLLTKQMPIDYSLTYVISVQIHLIPPTPLSISDSHYVLELLLVHTQTKI